MIYAPIIYMNADSRERGKVGWKISEAFDPPSTTFKPPTVKKKETPSRPLRTLIICSHFQYIITMRINITESSKLHRADASGGHEKMHFTLDQYFPSFHLSSKEFRPMEAIELKGAGCCGGHSILIYDY